MKRSDAVNGPAQSAAALACVRLLTSAATIVVAATPHAATPAVRATDFRSTKVYQSSQHPSYTSWVSFFPGEHRQWYLGCEEVTTPREATQRASKEWVYGMSLPRGYDKSKY